MFLFSLLPYFLPLLSFSSSSSSSRSYSFFLFLTLVLLAPPLFLLLLLLLLRLLLLLLLLLLLFLLLLLLLLLLPPSSSSSSSSSFSVLSTNARSLIPKRNELSAYVATEKPDVVAITETWANSTHLVSELSLPGYEIFQKKRTN